MFLSRLKRMNAERAVHHRDTPAKEAVIQSPRGWSSLIVFPAEAGIHFSAAPDFPYFIKAMAARAAVGWAPAFAGETSKEIAAAVGRPIF
jgi:hypothetical protein